MKIYDAVKYMHTNVIKYNASQEVKSSWLHIQVFCSYVTHTIVIDCTIGLCNNKKGNIGEHSIKMHKTKQESFMKIILEALFHF